jgi:hypothetical protein
MSKRPTKHAEQFVARIAQFNEWVGDGIRHGVWKDKRAWEEVLSAIWHLGRAERRLLYGAVNRRHVRVAPKEPE